MATFKTPTPKSSQLGRVKKNAGYLSNNSRVFGPVESVGQLFANGEQGMWYDISDLGSLAQDAAGTLPITTTGQSVGLVRDKSGNGNHKTAAGAARPTIQVDANGKFYLQYDGAASAMATAATVNFGTATKMTVLAGWRKDRDAGAQIILESSIDGLGANPGAFTIYTDPTPNYVGGGGGSIVQSTSTAGVLGAQSVVLRLTLDISEPGTRVAVNNGAIAANGGGLGVGTFGNYTFYTGARAAAGLFLQGREYQTIVRGALTTAEEIAKFQRFIASKMGIVLP